MFDAEGALDKFEAFASVSGARFYGLPLNEGTVTLERATVEVPERIESGEVELIPFQAGEALGWKLVD